MGVRGECFKYLRLCVCEREREREMECFVCMCVSSLVIQNVCRVKESVTYENMMYFVI